jgi:hypothetical protein
MKPGVHAEAVWALPLSAALLLWPAFWNGYPIVFADTGTYLSQAINGYMGWDRPPFYSLFMLPLHLTLTTWPVIVAQAILTVCVLRLVSGLRWRWLPGMTALLAVGTWLPFVVSQLMPDIFTPLLVLVLCAGATRWRWVFFAAFAIAAQQSSVLLSMVVLPFTVWGRARLLVAPVLGVAALLAVNAIGHHRLALSPYGNVFLLARVIYDGPGMTVLRRDCPDAGWRLCAYLDRFPPTSDDFLWRADSPIVLAGGHKVVSAEASAIIAAALRAEPGVQLQAVLRNGLEQIRRFESGDGLEAWPAEVTPWIERDFPAAERQRYANGLQARGLLVMPPALTALHRAVSLLGVLLCIVLLPVAFWRRDRSWKLLLTILVLLPASAVITGGLSTPHERYQARIMWLPPFAAALSLASLSRRRA